MDDDTKSLLNFISKMQVILHNENMQLILLIDGDEGISTVKEFDKKVVNVISECFPDSKRPEKL